MRRIQFALRAWPCNPILLSFLALCTVWVLTRESCVCVLQKEVTLQCLNLGSTPPDFSLIRALPSPQDGDDVVLISSRSRCASKLIFSVLLFLFEFI